MRKLVAIMFADMVGYTALMQSNEREAKEKRFRYRSLLNQFTASHNGEIIETYGDGSLTIFNSATDAVQCALDLQLQWISQPRVDVRIGIHIGDVTLEDGEIFGDGVNLASRIESLGVAGSILISDKVYDQVRNKENIHTQALGQFEFKNVDRSIHVYAVSNMGVVVPARQHLQGKTKVPHNRIAVLPFVNMSPDPDNEYFSDGITEELLNAFSKIDGIQVTSRTSAFSFKGKNVDVRDIGLQLNVDRILEGSVRKSGNKIRVTAQLINAADGYHIWSENYDRDLNDIFAIQDEISTIIANKFRLQVQPDHSKLNSFTDLNAYTFYLKGLHFWNKMTPPDTHQAITCFEKAIAIDQNYARAYAMMAAAYSYLGSSGQMMPHLAFGKVKLLAEQALQLDDALAEGYIAKGAYFLLYAWKWNEAYDALQKAIQINPAAISSYQLLGFYYVIVGNKAEAVRVMEKAAEYDPLSTIVNQHLGTMYVFNERFDDAIRCADQLIEMDPSMRAAIELKAWATGMQGDWAKALVLFQEVHRLTQHPLKGLMGVGYSYAMLGQREKAMDCVLKVEQRQRENPDLVLDGDLVGLSYALGQYDKVFHYIDQCIEKRISPPTLFLEYPAFKALRSDPRYDEMKVKFMSASRD